MRCRHSGTEQVLAYILKSRRTALGSDVLRAQVYLLVTLRGLPELTRFISAINLFSYSRPVPKNTRDGGEETWVEKTYFTTEESFPTVLRRSEIVAVEIVEVSPVERAINEVEQRTKELATMHLKYSMLAKTGQVVSTNSLTMALNAAVDSPLDSGIPSFRGFLTNDYIIRNGDKAELIDRLRNAIDDQVRVVNILNSLNAHAFLGAHD